MAGIARAVEPPGAAHEPVSPLPPPPSEPVRLLAPGLIDFEHGEIAKYSNLPPLEEQIPMYEHTWLARWIMGYTKKQRLLTYDFSKLVTYGGYISAAARGTVFTMNPRVGLQLLMWLLMSAGFGMLVVVVQPIDTIDASQLALECSG